jgi:hypothetical protein
MQAQVRPIRRRVIASILTALMAIVPVGVQAQSAGIEPLTGLPWRVVQSVNPVGAHGRVEYAVVFFSSRISRADIAATATDICRGAGLGLQKAVFPPTRDEPIEMRRNNTDLMTVRCK